MGLMLISVDWEPSPEVLCSTEQPISASDIAPELKLYTI
jgi:hypothetical protein